MVVSLFLFAGLVGAYAALLLLIQARLGQARKAEQNWPIPSVFPTVSVLIAFRNEEKNLPDLLASLRLLRFPKGNLAIILINDHSEDAGLECIQAFQQTEPEFPIRLLTLSENQTGKKAALRLGVAHAKGEWLAFTDADCLPDADWLAGLFRVQQGSGADLVCGSVQVDARRSSFRTGLDQLETAALIAVGAFGVLSGKPNFCNGANLLVRKADWLSSFDSRQDDNLAGGDDVFLLHALHQSGKKIIWALESETQVRTRESADWKGQLSQRIRWASKIRSGQSGSNLGMALLLWLFHLAFPIGLAALISQQHGNYVFLLLGLKTVAETLLMESFLPRPGFQQNSGRIWLYQIPYSLYVIVIGLFVILRKDFVWKGRRFRY